MTTDLTVTQLVDALQKSKAPAPAFRSLPQLQRFVDEINGRDRSRSSPSPGGEGRGEGGLSAQTETATPNAS